MYFTLRRIWGFIAFFLSIAIGSFLATNVGLGDDWGYGLGCISGLVIWAIGVTFLSTSIGPEKAEKKYLNAIKKAVDQIDQVESQRPEQNESIATNYCPNCGKPVMGSDRFCRSCGNPLTN